MLIVPFCTPCSKPRRISPFHESEGILLSVRPILTPVPTIATSSPRRAESVSRSTPFPDLAGRARFLREDLGGIEIPLRRSYEQISTLDRCGFATLLLIKNEREHFANSTGTRPSGLASISGCCRSLHDGRRIPCRRHGIPHRTRVQIRVIRI